MRFSEINNDEAYGERLIIIALRMLQDCPADGIALRKVTQFMWAIVLAHSFLSGIDGRFPSSHGFTGSKSSVPVFG